MDFGEGESPSHYLPLANPKTEPQDMTRRIPEAVLASPREQLFDQCNPHYSVRVAEDHKIEDTAAAAAGTVGGWVCGETNGNTSKVEREGLYYDADQDQNKRRRVVSSSTQYVPPSSIERQRERLSLAHVIHLQSPKASVSMADRRRQMPSSTYQRGVQW